MLALTHSRLNGCNMIVHSDVCTLALSLIRIDRIEYMYAMLSKDTYNRELGLIDYSIYVQSACSCLGLPTVSQ